MLDAFRQISERYRPFVVAAAELQEQLAPSPLGVGIGSDARFDPTRRSSVAFLSLLQRLDTLSYEELGMAMPRWVLYDCALLPGCVFGLGRPAAELEPAVREVLRVPEAWQGLVPLSMYIAIPSLAPRHWLGYSICGLEDAVPGAVPPELQLLTLAMAVDLLDIGRMTANVEWASPKLELFARFAPLAVKAAWLPAHSQPATCVFEFEATRERALRALRGPEPNPLVEASLLEPGDGEVLRRLQAEIESGRAVEIAYAFTAGEGGLGIPVIYGEAP